MRLTELQKEIVKAVADNDMKISKAAEELHLHRNTIKYHRKTILRTTGLDCLNFYELQKLLNMIEGDSHRKHESA